MSGNHVLWSLALGLFAAAGWAQFMALSVRSKVPEHEITDRVGFVAMFLIAALSFMVALLAPIAN